jgi:nitrate/nitrite-specific signal transduction histidine kinase
MRFKKNKDMMQCEVEDNGVGRKHSNPVRSKIKAESYGLKILAERLAIIEHVKRVETSLEFSDLDESDTSTGLLVSFNIPYETTD